MVGVGVALGEGEEGSICGGYRPSALLAAKVRNLAVPSGVLVVTTSTIPLTVTRIGRLALTRQCGCTVGRFCDWRGGTVTCSVLAENKIYIYI